MRVLEKEPLPTPPKHVNDMEKLKDLYEKFAALV